MRTFLLSLVSGLIVASCQVATAAETVFPTVTLKNDVAEIEVSTLQGSLKAVRLLGVEPIRTYGWHEAALTASGVKLPEAGKPLAVLDEFNPNGGKHNWLAGLELPVDSKPWEVAQADARHVTLSTSDVVKGLKWSMTYELAEGKPAVTTALRIDNVGVKTIDLLPTIYPVNGIHQDDPGADAAYVTVGRHYGGTEGSIENLGMPAPGASEVIDANGLDYAVIKSRFFAALFAPVSAQISGGVPVAVAPAVAAVGESGGPGSAAPITAAAPGLTLATTAHGYALPVAQGATKHAYLQAAYTAGGAPVRLAPGQNLVISWRITATGLDKVSAARLDPIERKAEYTEGYYRFFRILAKACTWLLDITTKLVVNYGIAILVLTLLIKLALFKTTFKQQASMLKMQQLQPKLKLLQETYKNDKQKLAQKQMELWKENGVNPLGGCLPIFIQIPIFTSLYMAFSHSADMRGASFLWIKDLTLPDAVMGWVLPFSIPMIGHIITLNPLPIIYIGVTIWMSLSQKVPHGADPQQEQQMKMMRWLPVVFGLIFYAMPSGLVLYFTANAVLSTLEIKLVRRKLGLH